MTDLVVLRPFYFNLVDLNAPGAGLKTQFYWAWRAVYAKQNEFHRQICLAKIHFKGRNVTEI